MENWYREQSVIPYYWSNFLDYFTVTLFRIRIIVELSKVRVCVCENLILERVSVIIYYWNSFVSEFLFEEFLYRSICKSLGSLVRSSGTKFLPLLFKISQTNCCDEKAEISENLW